jgi:3-hydroxy-3-methylglutaryl CoA synthase
MSKAILILLLCAVSSKAGLSKLEAISMLETANNDFVIGSAGEVSRFQIMPAVWRRYSSANAYHNVELASRVAAQHLAVLETTFRARTGREPSDFDRYVLWNAGETYYAKKGFSAAKVHPVIRERARRFVNLRTMTQEVKPALLAMAKSAPRS